MHLLFGVAGLVMAARWDRASNYLLGAGLIYAVLTIFGLFVGKDDGGGGNFIPVNNEDDVLHGLLALALLGAWALTRRERRARDEPAAVRG